MASRLSSNQTSLLSSDLFALNRSRPTRQHVLRVLLIVSLLLATAGGIEMSVSAQAPAYSGIAWRACATAELPTRECGELEVPLDYDEPEGQMISIAVARVPATDQSQRIGSLFLNPGCPGISGVFALPIQYAPLPEPLRERFDVVGFDPRGVGESAPVRCFANVRESATFTISYLTGWIAPSGPAEETVMVAAFEDVARRCGERNAAILPHLSPRTSHGIWTNCGRQSAMSS